MSEQRTMRLYELGKVITGKTPSSKYPNDFGSDISFITPTDFKNYVKYINRSDRQLSPVGSQKLASKILPPKSVLITCIGSDMGKIALNPKHAVTNQQINSIIPTEGITTSDFLFYKLKNEYETLRSLGQEGTAVPIVNKSTFENIEVSIPPLPEQQGIAEVLSSLDDKIDLLHRNNKTLEEMAETLFRQWFVDDNTEMWSTVGDEFDVVMGQSPPGNTYNENEDGVPFYQGRTDFTLRFPSRRIFCSAPSRMAMAMDTLLSVRAPVGDTNIASEECCIGRGLAAIRHKDKTLHYSYTFLLFNFIRESFDVHEQSGTVFGSISKNELLALKCPRLSEPLMFNEKIAVIEDKVTHNSIQIEALSKLRNTLLPKLMSGQVRVNI